MTGSLSSSPRSWVLTFFLQLVISSFFLALTSGLSGCSRSSEQKPSEPQPKTETAASPGDAPAKKEPSAPSQLTPEMAQSLAEFNHGVGLLEQYQYADAAQAFDKVLAKYPNWTAARFNIGLALLNDQKDYPRAEKELLRVLQEDPNHRWAHFCLGVYYQLLPDGNQKALEHLEQVRKADPDDLYAAYEYTQVLKHLNKNDEAIGILQDIVKHDPGFISAAYSLADSYRRARQPAKAAPLNERFRALKPQELTAGSFEVVNPYMGKGKYWSALDASNLPIQPSPMNPAPRVIFSPDVKSLDSALGAWKWAGGEVAIPGVAVGDLDGDGDLDLVICGAGENGDVVLLMNDGKGAFTVGPKLADHGTSPVLGDVDNDGDLDLWLGRAGGDLLFLNDGKGHFEPAPKSPEEASETRTTCARLIDIDSDGDLDFLATQRAADQKAAPSRVFLNKLDGTYTDIATELGLAFPDTPLAALLADDLDGDRDIDLVIVPAQGQPLCWENFRVGQYKLREAKDTGLDAEAATSATMGDPFKTGHRDFLISTGKEIILYRHRAHWKYERDAEFSGHCGTLGGTSAQFVDIDNDGDLDIIIPDAHRKNGTRGPELLINDWPHARFVPAAEADPGNLFSGLETHGDAIGVAADFNGDGLCDYLLLEAGSKPKLITNATAGGHWIGIDLVGSRDQQKMSRCPASAIGARVELRAGSVSQQLVVGTPAGPTAMPPLRLLAGLGDQTNLQWLRILWPDSVLQAELEKPSNQVITVTELNRRPSSCPHLFVWDGQRFEFVSDFGGVGGLGYCVGPNEFAYPDSTEYVRLPHIEPQGDAYVLQVVEPLEEIVYFDEARLIAVDHPIGTEAHPNEMAAVSAPPPPFELYCFRNVIEPERALDHRGQDVTTALRTTDRVTAGATDPDRRYRGYASDHFIDLDFGDRLKAAPKSARRVLLLDGWVEYSTSTSNYAASQAGLRLKAPSIFVERAGNWVELMHEVGYPAGINHIMTLDLTGQLQPDDRKLRIATNMDLYWDRIGIAVVTGDAHSKLTEAAPASADLHFLGFPREYSPDGRQPNLFDYANIDTSTTWLKLPGNYTRYGDVTELIQKPDDRFVIMASGDEITLRFPASAFGPVPPGFTRTFLLKADSYCKDMDLYTGAGDRVEPWPFHAMTAYPYGAEQHFPESDATRRDRERYHTRILKP